MKNNLFSKFVPQRNEYFVMLSELADAVHTTAELTVHCVRSDVHTDVVEYSAKIREQKRIGARLQGQIIRELHNSFITPFDREDINNLAIHMKGVIDHISSCAKRIMLYEPKTMPEAGETLAELVRESTEVVQKAIEMLPQLKKKPQNITHLCKQLESIESKSDEIYENFLVKLFKNETDIIELIKLKDILHELEKATDSSEHVGKIIGTIVVKYA